MKPTGDDPQPRSPQALDAPLTTRNNHPETPSGATPLDKKVPDESNSVTKVEKQKMRDLLERAQRQQREQQQQ